MNRLQRNTNFAAHATLLIALISLPATFVLCQTASQTRPTKTQTFNPTSDTGVNYEGVSFTFDSTLASEVEAEILPELIEGKWTDIGPEFPLFTFNGYPNESQEGGTAEIRVFSISKFREVARKSSAWYNSTAYPADVDLRKDFDEEVRVLKLLLAKKPLSTETGRFLGQARGSGGCGAMPFLPMWEWCQAFATRPKYITFKNGEGVFYLAHMDRETSQVTQANLHYIFQGITGNGEYYVSALFPVAAPFLPKDSLVPKVQRWDTENYLLSRRSRKYRAYVNPIIAKLNALHAKDFTPHLDLPEHVIQSLWIR
jgi:hypothetical protein